MNRGVESAMGGVASGNRRVQAIPVARPTTLHSGADTVIWRLGLFDVDGRELARTPPPRSTRSRAPTTSVSRECRARHGVSEIGVGSGGRVGEDDGRTPKTARTPAEHVHAGDARDAKVGAQGRVAGDGHIIIAIPIYVPVPTTSTPK